MKLKLLPALLGATGMLVAWGITPPEAVARDRDHGGHHSRSDKAHGGHHNSSERRDARANAGRGGNARSGNATGGDGGNGGNGGDGGSSAP
jgi:hypothetical protein